MKRLLRGLLPWVLLLALAPASIAQTTTLAQRIQSIMDRPDFRHAIFGIEFYSLDAGKPIYTVNADKLFTPGSTTKLLTEGTALGLLGADFIQTASPAAGRVHAKTGTFLTYDALNRRLLVTGKGFAGYMTTRIGERLAFAIYVNNVSVPTERDAVKKITGQALGEIAAAAY